MSLSLAVVVSVPVYMALFGASLNPACCPLCRVPVSLSPLNLICSLGESCNACVTLFVVLFAFVFVRCNWLLILQSCFVYRLSPIVLVLLDECVYVRVYVFYVSLYCLSLLPLSLYTPLS